MGKVYGVQFKLAVNPTRRKRSLKVAAQSWGFCRTFGSTRAVGSTEGLTRMGEANAEPGLPRLEPRQTGLPSC